MRLLLIALYAIVSSIAFQGPAQAKKLTYAEVETVCGTKATTGVDEYGRTYIYCMRFCGVDGEKVCYYRCTGLVCEGFILSTTTEPGTPPEEPKQTATTHGPRFDSLSGAGGSDGGAPGGSSGGSRGETHGSFATTASPSTGGAPSFL
jgi:hypothetical protein